jgi:hypothetical protein
MAWFDWAQVAAAAFAAGAALAIPVTAYRRRPSLKLTEKEATRHSRVEGDERAYLRLLVSNERRHRAAQGTRVLVEGYRRQSESESELVSLAYPALEWPSERADEPTVTVYAGAGRPVGLGKFVRARRTPEGRLIQGSGGAISLTTRPTTRTTRAGTYA